MVSTNFFLSTIKTKLLDEGRLKGVGPFLQGIYKGRSEKAARQAFFRRDLTEAMLREWDEADGTKTINHVTAAADGVSTPTEASFSAETYVRVKAFESLEAELAKTEWYTRVEDGDGKAIPASSSSEGE